MSDVNTEGGCGSLESGLDQHVDAGPDADAGSGEPSEDGEVRVDEADGWPLGGESEGINYI